jgi:hypothetical protein
MNFNFLTSQDKGIYIYIIVFTLVTCVYIIPPTPATTSGENLFYLLVLQFC